MYHQELLQWCVTSLASPERMREAVYELRKQSNGASGGLSRWTKELLMAAVTIDATILDDLGVILARIVNEDAPSNVLEIYRCCQFTPLDKELADLDVRPLAVGCAMQKLLASVCFLLDAPTLPKWQFGLGIPNATAFVVD